MKHTRQRPVSALGIAVILGLALAFFGCASTPPDRAALNTLQTVKASAESAMTVAGNLYQAGQITDAQKAQAIGLYQKIELSSKTAAAALRLVTTTGQADAVILEVQQLLAQLQKLVATFAPGPTSWYRLFPTPAWQEA